MPPEVVDIAGTKLLILLNLVLMLATGGLMFLAGFCVGRYGRKKPIAS